MNIDFSYQLRLYLGLYETEINPWLQKFCQPGFDAFDIGGREGYDGLLLAKLTRGGRVVSVDAEPAAADLMRANFALNADLASGLTARHATVAAVTDAAAGELALDDLATDVGFVPDVMKIDIDGGEVDALEGAKRILGERKPALIIEVHSKELEAGCDALLRTFGYEPQVVGLRRFMPDYRPIPHNRWLVAAGDRAG
jgi:hypothetical protein